jgi:hypothetical protein
MLLPLAGCGITIMNTKFAQARLLKAFKLPFRHRFFIGESRLGVIVKRGCPHELTWYGIQKLQIRKMRAMKRNKESEDRIVSIWRSRPANKRRQNDTEVFTNEVWDAGLRLANNKDHHYQYVMNLIRFSISDGE